MTPSSFEKSTIEARREFVRGLRDRVGVAKVDFTRDGFETVFVQFEVGEADFEAIVDDARDLGFEYDDVGPHLYRFEVVDR